jgi:hypothetical protein
MRTAYRIGFLGTFVAGVALASAGLAAEDLAVPMVAGTAVHCSDSTGAVVYTRFVSQLNGWAAPTIDPATGNRLIVIDRPVALQKPRLVQLFLYAHECGHHVSGDVSAGQGLREVDVRLEKNADKVGIRLLRDQLHIGKSQADALATIVHRDSMMFPSYEGGAERAEWIRNCFATNDEDCTGTKPVDQSTPFPGGASTVTVATNVVREPPIEATHSIEMAPPAHRFNLDSALPALADASLSGFVFVKYRDTSTIAVSYNGQTIGAKNIAAAGGLPRFQYMVYSGTDGLVAKRSFEVLDTQATDILQKWQKNLKDNTRNLGQDRSWLMHSTFRKKVGSVDQEFDIWLTKRTATENGNDDVHFDVYLEAVSASKSNK